VDGTGNFYKRHKEIMGCHKADRMEREEALSALCRMGKAHGRFSGNQRNVKGRQYLKIVAEHFESGARSPLISLPLHHPE
jgi:hypothetical protein